MQETLVQFLGQEDPLEKGLATHSSILGLPCGSAGEESTCNAGDPRLIPELGRSTAEGIGSPLQYSWASFVAQTVKKPSAMRETWFQFLGWEDPLAKGMATHFSIQAWVSKSWAPLSNFHFHNISLNNIYAYFNFYNKK